MKKKPALKKNLQSAAAKLRIARLLDLIDKQNGQIAMLRNEIISYKRKQRLAQTILDQATAVQNCVVEGVEQLRRLQGWISGASDIIVRTIPTQAEFNAALARDDIQPQAPNEGTYEERGNRAGRKHENDRNI